MVAALQQEDQRATLTQSATRMKFTMRVPHYLEIVNHGIRTFDSSGTLIGMDLYQREGYEEVDFDMGAKLVKVDGEVRVMTADEISAAITAANNAALADIHRGTRNRLLAESDFVVIRL